MKKTIFIIQRTLLLNSSADSKKSSGKDFFKSGFTFIRGTSSSELKFCKAFEIRLLWS